MKVLAVILLALASLFNSGKSFSEEGRASYYSDKLHGRKTASGQRYNKYLFTAAHATLPFNTLLQVTNLENGKSVTVRINDRIPKNEKKVIDVSKAAAREIGMLAYGMVPVRLQEVQEQYQNILPAVDSIELLTPIQTTL
ncbi:MAG: septal ring lytic transglycosylase RlpA family protein [Hymenobacteraceae bacterium]|nr:septal ring lytic transglycosylase RlpA family protein [Hymenobacteraceae bacterium]MDX5395623.1 septal ring lytic transglycosylase RlpA family protein [Hymenobacteraceae bacterium]MDX5443421.1 septal ring lytic transglycosylase RlpA family protein [Hymenobacteraceae bacterium]MDX5511677.1 septal ring lytic transglycosylase RlpA family protein [Hymenobacteraceae bacterium]